MEKDTENKGINKGFIDNQWKEGESGNPKGRPIGQKNYATLYREALIKIAKDNETTPDAIEARLLSKGVANAIAGDYRFYKDVLDRIHGTALQKSQTEVTTPIPILYVSNNNSNKEDTSTEQAS